jgi:hypothetical protein
MPPTELTTLTDDESLAMHTTLRRLASAGGAPFGAAARDLITLTVTGPAREIS